MWALQAAATTIIPITTMITAIKGIKSSLLHPTFSMYKNWLCSLDFIKKAKNVNPIFHLCTNLTK